MPKISPEHEQRRRDQILAAAMACFARSGYRATSMEDVVREAGLSVGALYTYFPSKEDIFIALADRRMESTLAEMRTLFNGPGTMADKSARAVDLFFDQLEAHFVPLTRVSLELWGEASRSSRFQERYCQRIEALRTFFHWLLTSARHNGELRPDVDVDAAAELLMAMNDGILMHHVQGVITVSREALKAAYIQLFNTGLATPAQPFMPATPAPVRAAQAPLLRSGGRPRLAGRLA